MGIFWIIWILTTCVVIKTNCENGCYYFNTQRGTIECFNTTLKVFKLFQRTYDNRVLTKIKITHSKLQHLVAGVFINGWPRSMNRTVFSEDLRSLDLSHNDIENIEMNAFYDLPNVVTLNLEHNNLTSISPALDSLKDTLIILNLAHNKITHLEAIIFTSFVNLRVLYLNNNRIRYVYENNPFRRSVRIEDLNLRHNHLTEFPVSVLKLLYKVQKVDLSHNKLKSFDVIFLNDSQTDYSNDFYPFYNLRELYLNNNKLIDFDVDKLRYLKYLRYIKIQGNAFTCARYGHILKELVNIGVNVTLTDDMFFNSQSMCVDQQPQINEATFFQRNKVNILMAVEFTLAALVVLIPVVIILYIVKFIYFRVGDDDVLELRPFQ